MKVETIDLRRITLRSILESTLYLSLGTVALLLSLIDDISGIVYIAALFFALALAFIVFPSVRIFIGPVLPRDALFVSRRRIDNKFISCYELDQICWTMPITILSTAENDIAYAILSLKSGGYYVIDYKLERGFGTKANLRWSCEGTFEVRSKSTLLRLIVSGEWV